MKTSRIPKFICTPRSVMNGMGNGMGNGVGNGVWSPPPANSLVASRAAILKQSNLKVKTLKELIRDEAENIGLTPKTKEQTAVTINLVMHPDGGLSQAPTSMSRAGGAGMPLTNGASHSPSHGGPPRIMELSDDELPAGQRRSPQRGVYYHRPSQRARADIEDVRAEDSVSQISSIISGRATPEHLKRYSAKHQLLSPLRKRNSRGGGRREAFTRHRPPPLERGDTGDSIYTQYLIRNKSKRKDVGIGVDESDIDSAVNGEQQQHSPRNKEMRKRSKSRKRDVGTGTDQSDGESSVAEHNSRKAKAEKQKDEKHTKIVKESEVQTDFEYDGKDLSDFPFRTYSVSMSVQTSKKDLREIEDLAQRQAATRQAREELQKALENKEKLEQMLEMERQILRDAQLERERRQMERMSPPKPRLKPLPPKNGVYSQINDMIEEEQEWEEMARQKRPPPKPLSPSPVPLKSPAQPPSRRQPPPANKPDSPATPPPLRLRPADPGASGAAPFSNKSEGLARERPQYQEDPFDRSRYISHDEDPEPAIEEEDEDDEELLQPRRILQPAPKRGNAGNVNNNSSGVWSPEADRDSAQERFLNSRSNCSGNRSQVSDYNEGVVLHGVQNVNNNNRELSNVTEDSSAERFLNSRPSEYGGAVEGNDGGVNWRDGDGASVWGHGMSGGAESSNVNNAQFAGNSGEYAPQELYDDLSAIEKSVLYADGQSMSHARIRVPDEYDSNMNTNGDKENSVEKPNILVITGAEETTKPNKSVNRDNDKENAIGKPRIWVPTGAEKATKTNNSIPPLPAQKEKSRTNQVAAQKTETDVKIRPRDFNEISEMKSKYAMLRNFDTFSQPSPIVPEGDGVLEGNDGQPSKPSTVAGDDIRPGKLKPPYSTPILAEQRVKSGESHNHSEISSPDDNAVILLQPSYASVVNPNPPFDSKKGLKTIPKQNATDSEKYFYDLNVPRLMHFERNTPRVLYPRQTQDILSPRQPKQHVSPWQPQQDTLSTGQQKKDFLSPRQPEQYTLSPRYNVPLSRQHKTPAMSPWHIDNKSMVSLPVPSQQYMHTAALTKSIAPKLTLHSTGSITGASSNVHRPKRDAEVRERHKNHGARQQRQRKRRDAQETGSKGIPKHLNHPQEAIAQQSRPVNNKRTVETQTMESRPITGNKERNHQQQPDDEEVDQDLEEYESGNPYMKFKPPNKRTDKTSSVNNSISNEDENVNNNNKCNEDEDDNNLAFLADVDALIDLENVNGGEENANNNNNSDKEDDDDDDEDNLAHLAHADAMIDLEDVEEETDQELYYIYLRSEDGTVVGPFRLDIDQVALGLPTTETFASDKGLRNRATGSNSINEHSSRSHSMLTLHIDSDEQEVEDDNLYVTKHGKLTFVDLAGSEKYEPRPDQQKSTSHLLESNNINRSLLVLGNCISALGDPRKRGGHIPYRDSKLTKLLADSLSGGGVTLMIACISPGMANASESMNTLRYANRAKHIKTKPVVKMDPREKLILTLKREIKVLRQENHYLRQQLEFPVKPRGQLQKENDEKFMKLLQDHKKADPSGKVTDHGLYEMLQEYMIENEILRGENSDLHQIRDHSRREQQVLARENEHLQRKVESIQKEHQELQTPLSQYSTGTASTHISLPKSGFKSGNDSATSILSQRSSHQQALYQAGGPPLTHRDGPPMGPSYQPAATGFTGQIPNGYIGQMPSGYVGQSPNGYVAGQVPQNGYNMGFIPQTNGYTMGQMAAQMPAAGSPRSSGHYTPGGSKKPPHHLPDSIKNSPAYLDNSPRGSLSQPPSQASSYSQKLRQPDPPPGYSQRFQQQQQQLQQQQSPSSSQRPSIDSGSLPGSQRASLDMGPPPPLRREPQQQPVQRTSRVSSVNPTQAEDDELESVTDLNERLRRELLDLEGQIQHEHRAPGGGYPSPRHAPWGVGGFPQQPPPGHATMGGPGGGGSPPKPTPRAGQNSGWR